MRYSFFSLGHSVNSGIGRSPILKASKGIASLALAAVPIPFITSISFRLMSFTDRLCTGMSIVSPGWYPLTITGGMYRFVSSSVSSESMVNCVPPRNALPIGSMVQVTIAVSPALMILDFAGFTRDSPGNRSLLSPSVAS